MPVACCRLYFPHVQVFRLSTLGLHPLSPRRTALPWLTSGIWPARTAANPLSSAALSCVEFADPCWPCSLPGCRAQPVDFWHPSEKRPWSAPGSHSRLIWSRGAPNKPAEAVLRVTCNGLVTALNFTELDQSCLECDRNGQASCTAPRAALAQCRDLLTQPRSLQQHTHTPRLWTSFSTTSPPPALLIARF